MATCKVLSNTTGPRGYPLQIFETVDPKYLCGTCKMILKNPIQSFCGHRFCRECFEHLIRSNGGAPITCFLCEDEAMVTEYSSLTLEQTFPDNALRREFLKLSARCPHPNCTWSGSFKDFEVHFIKCEFASDADEGTGSLQMNDGSFADNYQALNQKLTTVEQFVTGLRGRIDKLEPAIQRVESELIRKDSTPSETTSVRTGGTVSVAAVASGRAVASGGAAANPSAEGGNLVEAEEKMNIFEGIITVLDRELEKYSLQMESQERQHYLFHDLLTVTDRKFSEVERLMATKDVAIADLDTRVSCFDQTSYDGTLIWKISNFQQRRQDAITGSTTSFYSPPFYTSKTGYKMCARIYLNGDGMGKGTHVSLFFVVLRGPYDALLQWPFRQKVTLMFLDQSNRENVTDSFRPDPTSSSFKRPTVEMNIASGCPLFMPLTMLDSTAHAYVKDNTAFIKIIVNLDGMT